MAQGAPPPSGRYAALYPYLLLSACMLMWAGNWVLGRALRDSMPPVAMTFWRWTVATLVLAPFALPRLIGKRDVLKRSWPLLLGLAICGLILRHGMGAESLAWTVIFALALSCRE